MPYQWNTVIIGLVSRIYTSNPYIIWSVFLVLNPHPTCKCFQEGITEIQSTLYVSWFVGDGFSTPSTALCLISGGFICRQHCCKPSRSSKSAEIHKKIMRSCLPRKTRILHVWGYFTPITQREIMKLSHFWHHLGDISLKTVGFWALNQTLLVLSRVITCIESHEHQNSSNTLDLKINNNFWSFFGSASCWVWNISVTPDFDLKIYEKYWIIFFFIRKSNFVYIHEFEGDLSWRADL